MNVVIRLVPLLACLLIPSTGLAQVFEGCVFGGAPVPTIASTAINDVAVASVANGRPVILFNPVAIASFSRAMRNFVYMHECGHHALGHIVRATFGMVRPLVDEQEADCWAIRTMMQRGMLSSSDLNSVQETFWQHFRGDWMHLPGPQRAINLRTCLGASPSTVNNTVRTPVCRDVTTWVMRVDYVVQVVPQRMPCRHPMRTPWGIRMMHPFDMVPTQQRVPVQRRVPVVQRVCE
jgi:hypothetical protein